MSEGVNARKGNNKKCYFNSMFIVSLLLDDITGVVL
jgi:hypothetical protein